MKNRSSTIVPLAAILLIAWFPLANGQQADTYPWMRSTDPKADVADRIAPPKGFERVVVVPGSFAGWLQGE